MTHLRICSSPKNSSIHGKPGYRGLAPLAYMRGRTLKFFYHLDEAQNTTAMSDENVPQTLVENSKMAVTGDIGFSRCCTRRCRRRAGGETRGGFWLTRRQRRVGAGGRVVRAGGIAGHGANRLGTAGGAVGGVPVALASEAELERIFGDCELGALPPFGGAYGLRTVVDASLSAVSDILCASNMRHEGIRLRYRDYETLEAPLGPLRGADLNAKIATQRRGLVRRRNTS